MLIYGYVSLENTCYIYRSISVVRRNAQKISKKRPIYRPSKKRMKVNTIFFFVWEESFEYFMEVKIPHSSRSPTEYHQ